MRVTSTHMLNVLCDTQCLHAMADLTFRIWYHLSKHPSSDYDARFGPRASRTCRTATSYSNIQFKFNLNSIFSNVGTPNHLKLLIKGKEGGG